MVLASTHERALEIVPLEALRENAVDVPVDPGALDACARPGPASRTCTAPGATIAALARDQLHGLRPRSAMYSIGSPVKASRCTKRSVCTSSSPAA